VKRALSILSAAALLFASPVIAQNSTIVEEAGYQNKILILQNITKKLLLINSLRVV
jgi:hypothetical protein